MTSIPYPKRSTISRIDSRCEVSQAMKKEFLDNAPTTIWAEGGGLKHHVELQLDAYIR